MKRKYRIMPQYRGEEISHYTVEMWWGFHWIAIKGFQDEDLDFAKREAEELLETLEGGKDVKVRLL